MKNTILSLVAIASVSLATYFALKPEPKPLPAPALVAIHAPEPTPKPTPRLNLAPAGTYFLRSYLSVPTGKGIVGWIPGQQVSEIEDAQSTDGKLAVTDGVHSARVMQSLLTNNLDEAARLQRTDAADQNNLGAMMTNAQMLAAAQEQRSTIDAAHRIDVMNANKSIADSKSAIQNNPLHAKPVEYRNAYKSRSGHSAVIDSIGCSI